MTHNRSQSAKPASFLALLKRPGASRLVAWSSLARLVFGGLPLAVLVFIADARNSYGQAGLALAVYGIFAGMLGPYRTRIAERHNVRIVITVMSLLYLGAIGLFVVVAHEPLVVLLAAAALGGALPPPVGPLTRAEWRRRLGGDSTEIRIAYSFDATCEQVLYVAAPMLASFAIGVTEPAFIVLAGGVTLCVSGIGLAATLTSERVGVPGRSPVGDVRKSGSKSLSRNLPFLIGLTPITGLYFMMGGIEVSIVAAATETASSQVAGIPVAAVALGSAIGSYLYGRRDYPGSLRQQVLVFVLAGAAFTLVAAAVVEVLALTVAALALAGLWIAPAIVCSYLIAERAAPDAGAEASAWVNSAGNLSLACGTAIAGLLVQASSPAATLGLLVAIGVVIALLPDLVLRARGRGMRPDPPARRSNADVKLAAASPDAAYVSETDE